MNEWEKNRRMAESYRQSYPPGTRLELIGMDDPFAPIPAGMRGTVNYVDDQSQIHVKWDNGSGLALTAINSNEGSSFCFSITISTKY